MKGLTYSNNLSSNKIVMTPNNVYQSTRRTPTNSTKDLFA